MIQERKFLSRYYILYFKRMTSGCENFLSVVFIISQMPTFTPTEPIHVILLFALYTKSIMKDVRRFQGSSIGRQIHESILNSNMLDEQVKILGKQSRY